MLQSASVLTYVRNMQGTEVQENEDVLLSLELFKELFIDDRHLFAGFVEKDTETWYFRFSCGSNFECMDFSNLPLIL